MDLFLDLYSLSLSLSTINALQYSTFMVEDVQGHVQGRALSVSSQNLEDKN